MFITVIAQHPTLQHLSGTSDAIQVSRSSQVSCMTVGDVLPMSRETKALQLGLCPVALGFLSNPIQQWDPHLQDPPKKSRNPLQAMDKRPVAGLALSNQSSGSRHSKVDCECPPSSGPRAQNPGIDEGKGQSQPEIVAEFRLSNS